jgi:hypothetical protein
MQATVVDFGNDSVVFNITGATKAELENKLNLFFAAENLPLKTENGEERVYQRGNKTLRVLLGVFVKYFKVLVTVRQQNDLFSVRLVRDMNLILSGGAIGIVKSRKEFTRITEAFKVFMNN